MDAEDAPAPDEEEEDAAAPDPEEEHEKDAPALEEEKKETATPEEDEEELTLERRYELLEKLQDWWASRFAAGLPLDYPSASQPLAPVASAVSGGPVNAEQKSILESIQSEREVEARRHYLGRN